MFCNPFETGFNTVTNKSGDSLCTIGNTVIKTILRALTGMLSNSPALQRTPSPPQYR